MTPRSRLLVLSLALVGIAVSALDADARGRRDHYQDPYSQGGYVTVDSEWGNGSVSGAVRPGRNGYQVQMPGGTWIDCGRSCSETLRLATVDFWQSQAGAGNGSQDGSPKYLNRLFGF